MKKVNRYSNFELLRIFSMMLIIVYHIVLHGVFDGEVFNYNGNPFFMFFLLCGKIGVALYVMITGYFMFNKEIKISKIVGMELKVLFYCIVCFCLFSLFGHDKIVVYDYLRTLFPVVFNTYWFYSSFVVLYLLIPYFNIIINNIDERKYRFFLLTGFIFLFLIPFFNSISYDYSQLMYVFFYYFLGTYIGKYCDKFRVNNIILILGIIFMYGIAVFLGSFLFDISFMRFIVALTGLKSIFVLIVSVCIFLLFKNIKINNLFVINKFGSFCFGVYLFHENFFMRKLLWKKLFCISNYSVDTLYGIKILGIGIFVFLLCSFIEWIRQIIFDFVRQYIKFDIKSVTKS